MSDNKNSVFFILVSTFIHAGVLLVYWQKQLWQSFPLTWSYPFATFMILSAVLSACLPMVRHSRTRIGIMMFRIIMNSILAVPTASDPQIMGVLQAWMLYESFLFLPLWIAIYTFLANCGYTLLLSKMQVSLWFTASHLVDVGSLLVTYVMYAVAGYAGFFLARERRLHAQSMKILEQLNYSSQFIAETNINLQNLAADIKQVTLTEERTRIAREIHDTVAYTLTNLLSLLDAYREQLLVDNKDVPDFIVHARSLVRGGLGDIRRVLRGMRPSEDDGVSGLGSVKNLIEVFSKATGIKVITNFGQVPQFPGKNMEDAFYRVVQEGLTNAFRHGRATEILVTFYYEIDGIELTVRDNGQGSDVMSGGFGLVGIHERIASLGGKVTISSKSGFGFTLRVWLPLNQEEEDDGITSLSDRG
ncbi:sensor histidine kinase [Paenibacillus sp. TAB 01]|uniref:sensor histidine kinase n=1 Tax=Paenibacillus sp. TAB 01 TaxID=3368988 RepID=UPI0037507AF1